MYAHKKLSAWQGSMEIVVKVYHVTAGFPKTEMFGLSSQIRRSAGSIPANISEGAGRDRPKEFIRFLRISSGSLSELDTHIDLAFRLNYIDLETFHDLRNSMKIISTQIFGLIRAVEKTVQNQSPK